MSHDWSELHIFWQTHHMESAVSKHHFMWFMISSDIYVVNSDIDLCQGVSVHMVQWEEDLEAS